LNRSERVRRAGLTGIEAHGLSIFHLAVL
jgi:hypothetical protein